MTNASQPSITDFSNPITRELILSLARSAPAEILASAGTSAESFETAVNDYLRLAKASGLPLRDWRVNEARGPWMWILASPLALLIHLRVCSAERARAAELFAQAGAPLWSSRWIGSSRAEDTVREDPIMDADSLALFILEGSDAPLRRVCLRLALSDPLTPDDFPSVLKERFDESVAKSSKTAKGVLGPQDKKAKALCSLINALEPEILQAQAGRGWAPLGEMLAEAKERLAVKAAKPAAQSPDAVKRSASKEQKQRVAALALVIQKYPSDSGFILAGLEASPWLKDKPALAGVKLSSKGSLLSQTLAAGCSSALEWLEAAGANPWLASAQDGENNACLWAMQRMGAFPAGSDFSGLARMLLRGAWLDGAPDPKERCATLAAAAVEEFAAEWAPYNGGEQAVAKARSLLASLERLTLDEIIASQAQTESAPAAPKPRRGAL